MTGLIQLIQNELYEYDGKKTVTQLHKMVYLSTMISQIFNSQQKRPRGALNNDLATLTHREFIRVDIYPNNP